jgi:hypothetical protein
MDDFYLRPITWHQKIEKYIIVCESLYIKNNQNFSHKKF